MSTIDIPAQVVENLRAGAKLALGAAASSIAGYLERGTKTPPLDARREFDEAWALLHALGWGGEPAPAALELRDHRAALEESAERMLPLTDEWLLEMEPDDPRRAEREDEHRHLLAFSVQVRHG